MFARSPAPPSPIETTGASSQTENPAARRRPACAATAIRADLSRDAAGSATARYIPHFAAVIRRRRAAPAEVVLIRTTIRDAVPDLTMPAAAVLAEAATGANDLSHHDAAAGQIPALHQIEIRQPVAPRAAPATLRIAAWNVERCQHGAASAALLRRTGASLVLLSEMDLGMARSGNRHTTRDIAEGLGAGYAFGVEFVELGLGFGREIIDNAGLGNAGCLHGNAVVSAVPMRDPFLIPLDRGGDWFGLDWHHRRIGGRMALGVTIDLERGPVAMVSLHLENRSSPADRCRAIEDVLAGLDACAPGLPAVVAGDLNVAAMPDPAHEPDLDWFVTPEKHEPLFAALRGAGFAWRTANTPDQTRRLIPDGRPPPRARRIDWIFTRGLTASRPRTLAAVDEQGQPLSDHEVITVDIA